MTGGVRHDDLRRRNRALVLAAIRRGGGRSRTEIASLTGLSPSTISTISSDLLAEGILTQNKLAGETASLRRGRPQVSLGLDPDAALVATIVLSLNHLAAFLIDYSGEVVWSRDRRLETLAAPREELMLAVEEAMRELVERPERSHRPVLYVAMAVQGITDADGRSLLWSPITPHGNVPFADRLEEAFGIPVTIENDCNMIALALREREPVPGRDSLAAILLSDGIGMGLVLSGKLFKGIHSSGGEFGHMTHVPAGALCRCGRRGCIEAYAGNYAIVRRTRGLDEHATPEADISEEAMLDLARRAREADGPAREAFRAAGRAIGYGLGSLFALVDPVPVMVVGSGTAAFDIIEPALRQALGETAGGQGAGTISIELERDERPLMREGCVRRALAYVDENIVAPAASPGLGSHVA